VAMLWGRPARSHVCSALARVMLDRESERRSPPSVLAGSQEGPRLVVGVLSVEVGVGEVEAMIERGVGPGLPEAARCPVCDGELCLWPRTGYLRFVRLGGVTRQIWLRRAVCRVCGVTHALRPSFLLAFRRDVVRSVGFALVRAADGEGHRRIAEGLAIHEATVRSWLSRARSGAWRWRRRLLAIAVELGAEIARAPPGPLPGALEALLGALMIAYAAAVERFGEPACDGLWGFCSRVTAGRLIAPEQPT